MQKREKGITLIALIITIIILIILAGISISALSGSGLFERAQQAKQESENAQVNEDATLGEYGQWMTNYLGGSSSESETLASKVQPGEYVKYAPDPVATTDTAYTNMNTELTTYSGSTSNTVTQETGLKWRVLDVVDGKVRLISEVPTTSKVTLSEAKGYNNAVYLLDKTCQTLYSKSGYSEKVQSLKIEDIQDYLKYDYTQYENSDVDTGKYGGTKEYTSSGYRYYPKLFAKEKTGWVDGTKGTELDLSEQITPLIDETSTPPIVETSTQAEEKIKITQTYWYKSMAKGDFTKSIYYDLFIKKKKEDGTYSNYSTYWLSSRCVSADSYIARFCVRNVHSGSVDADLLCNSVDDPSSSAYALRPVVTLNPNVLVTTGDGTSATPYEIGL